MLGEKLNILYKYTFQSEQNFSKYSRVFFFNEPVRCNPGRIYSIEICIFIENFPLSDTNSLHPLCPSYILRRSLPLRIQIETFLGVFSHQGNHEGSKGNERKGPRLQRVFLFSFPNILIKVITSLRKILAVQ